MRRWIIAFACVTSLVGCQKAGPSTAFSSAEAATIAEAYLGEHETRAKELLEELTDLLVSNADEPDRAEQRVEAFLQMRESELVSNARALEAVLASKSGDERILYEENFSNYLAPTSRAYAAATKVFAEKHTNHWRRIDRRLNAAMNRRSGIASDVAPVPAPQPVPEPAQEPAPQPVP